MTQEHASQSGLDPSTHHHVQSLKSERDQYADDLQQVEKSFTELHRRYDKLRETITHHKRSEEKMKDELVDLRKQLRDSHLNFEVSLWSDSGHKAYTMYISLRMRKQDFGGGWGFSLTYNIVTMLCFRCYNLDRLYGHHFCI